MTWSVYKIVSVTLNFKIIQNKKNKLVLGPSCVPRFEFVPELACVEIAIVQFAYYVERKLFGMHFWCYSFSLLRTQIKDLSPTLQMLLTKIKLQCTWQYLYVCDTFFVECDLWTVVILLVSD